MVDYFELLYWLCHGLALWYLNIASWHEHHQFRHRFRWLSVDGMHNSKFQSNSLTIKLTFSSFCSDPFPEKKSDPSLPGVFPGARRALAAGNGDLCEGNQISNRRGAARSLCCRLLGITVSWVFPLVNPQVVR